MGHSTKCNYCLWPKQVYAQASFLPDQKTFNCAEMCLTPFRCFGFPSDSAMQAESENA